MSRTVFLAGLPDDASERELHLLFALQGGCEAVDIRLSAHHGTVAFVQFQTEARAADMKTACNGLPYDPTEPHALLRAEMASSNLTSSSAQTAVPIKRPLDSSMLPAPPARRPALGPPSSGEPTHMRHPDGNLYSKAEWRDMYRGYREWDQAVAAATGQTTQQQPCKDYMNGRCDRGQHCRYNHGGDVEGQLARNTVCKDFLNGRCERGPGCRFSHDEERVRQACATVTITGLGAQVTEDYIRQLCGACEGFVVARMQGQGQDAATAHARYQRPEHARRAVGMIESAIGGFRVDGGPAVRVKMAAKDIK
eukprot:TRINITY_DN16785_c0_g1_i1.p1 TRINITY_DN16785_c0_g1~~TRINITY_DN16785_c0_g1_i1.p1  ORF type:complete len:327 (+),score=91.71 TRINITY_DN16785_c0_g1_i1:55-981(+)